MTNPRLKKTVSAGDKYVLRSAVLIRALEIRCHYPEKELKFYFKLKRDPQTNERVRIVVELLRSEY